MAETKTNSHFLFVFRSQILFYWNHFKFILIELVPVPLHFRFLLRPETFDKAIKKWVITTNAIAFNFTKVICIIFSHRFGMISSRVFNASITDRLVCSDCDKWNYKIMSLDQTSSQLQAPARTRFSSFAPTYSWRDREYIFYFYIDSALNK